jgi:hypothetical protein
MNDTVAHTAPVTRIDVIDTLETSSAVGPLLFTLLTDAVGSYERAATGAIALPIAVAIAAACAPLPAETGS